MQTVQGKPEENTMRSSQKLKQINNQRQLTSPANMEEYLIKAKNRILPHTVTTNNNLTTKM